MDTLADRVWLAWHSLPRERGKPPSWRSLERDYRISPATFSKVVKEQRQTLDSDTVVKVCEALRVSSQWLLRGEGTAPSPTGPVPSRHEYIGAPDPRADNPPPPPTERTIELDPRYQAIEAAVAYFPGRWSPSVVAAAQSIALEADALNPKQATAILEAVAARLGGLSIGDVEVGEDEAMPRRAKRK